MDYAGNSKKAKGEVSGEKKPEKVVEKVVVGEVVVQKRSLMRKFKDTFIEQDLKTVSRYLVSEVMIPAARNMIAETVNKGVDRVLFGGSMTRRGYGGYSAGPRITYNSPVSRALRGDIPRNAPPLEIGPRRASRYHDDLIMSSRDDAEAVLQAMIDIIDKYEIVSVGDLNELVGRPSSYTDNKMGWIYLGDVQIRQIRDGYLIDFPPPEPIQ